MNKMERNEQYPVYRTPFRIKSKQKSKNTPPKTDQQNELSTATRPIRFVDSPYSSKYARSHQSPKKPRTPALEGQKLDQPQQAKHFRMQSAPHNSARSNMAGQQGDLFTLQFHHEIKVKAKTQREGTTSHSSRKKINFEKELFGQGRYHSQRKFTVQVVNIQRLSEKHRNLVKKKLQTFDYKKVLEKPLTVGNKKLPRLVISEEGVARLERSR